MKPADANEQTIFDAARQMPDAQARAAYLHSACAGDSSLRERIQKLLAASQRADEFLAGDPLGLSESGRQTILVQPLSEAPGTIIGNYKLLEKLGEGGFGVVYMAEQKQPIKRRVALKIIKVGMDTREVVARFEAERQALALMDHPNIAKILDAGITDAPLPASGHPRPSSDEGRGPGEGSSSATRHPSLVTHSGRPYFVMELVRGIKITDYCDEKNLSTRERLDLFTQVCQAVQHAHQKGIIHRDLKPSNILVTVNDGVAVPKIIDFGIAKATQMELTEKTVFTRFHQFLGTPAYMSPEQTEITSVDIDTRSDIYSLGVLLYELLTGQTPFDTNELLKAGLDEMRRTIREVEPVKPSTRLTLELTTASARRSLKGGKGEREKRGTERASRGESPFPPFPSAPFPPRKNDDQPPDDEIPLPRLNQLKQLIPALRGDLDWIVMKCLEKDRARRYETANGLATDIQRHLSNEPVVARPPSNLYRFQKMVRRNKLAFAAAGGIAAALVVGLAIALWQSIEKTRAYKRAVAAEQEQGRLRQQAQTEAAKSQQVAQFLKEMLKGLTPSVRLGRDTTLVLREILDKTAQGLEKGLTNQPEVEMELRGVIAETYRDMGLVKEHEEITRASLNVARAKLGEDHPAFAETLAQLGEAQAAAGKLDDAERSLRDAWARLKKLHGTESDEVARALESLCLVLWRRGNLAQAEELLSQALAIRRKLHGNEHELVAESLNDLALVLQAEGKYSEAHPAFEEALEINRKLGKETPIVAVNLCNFGTLLQEEGNLSAAEARIQEALELDRRVNSETTDLPWILNCLGAVLRDRGKLDEAEARTKEALASRRKLLPDNHPDIAISLRTLAGILRDKKQPAEAEAALQAAAQIFRKNFGEENRDLAKCLSDLCLVLHDQGRLAEAEAAQDRALAIQKNLLGSENPVVATSLANLASVLMAQGKPGDAEPLLHQALTIREKLLPGHWKTFDVRSLLGACLLAQQAYATAEPHLLAGYEGLKRDENRMPIAGQTRLKETAQNLLQLYEKTGRTDRAAEWKQKLAEWEKAGKP